MNTREIETQEAKAIAQSTRNNPEEHIKEGFELPAPPTCDECDMEGYPIVHHTGDAWHWDWACDCGLLESTGLPGHSHAIEWPFKSDYAYLEHWKAAGFTDV